MKKLIPYNRITHAAKQNAKAINKLYKKQEQPLVLVAVLGGSVMWLSELMKHITVPCEVDFVKAKSYRDNKQGELEWKLKPSLELKDKNVVIVEDIVDTGITLKSVVQYIYTEYNPNSIKTCSMLLREGCEANPTFFGYRVAKDAYVVGFGLDDKEYNRNKPDIYEL